MAVSTKTCKRSTNKDMEVCTGMGAAGCTCMHISMESLTAQHTAEPGVECCDERLLWVG